ncbi:MAG: hypothetical protein ACI841_001095 [Planctomycetota bacterium]|jgi:hypothetical protein
MLGPALAPGFLMNGYLYLSYVVDRHHLLHFGTPQYDPTANDFMSAKIGRITRYTADASTSFTTLVPGSRKLLLGETIDSGFPVPALVPWNGRPHLRRRPFAARRLR